MLSNYATSKLVDHVFKIGYSPPATLYLCLCTADPTVAGTGSSIVETDYTNYVRKSFTATVFNAAALRKVVQALDVLFAQAAGVSTSDISHWAICDAAANGNMLVSGAFTTPWNVVNGNTPKVAAGQMELSVGASTNGFTDIAVHKMLNLMFRNVAWATPSGSMHFGLTTAVMTDASTMATITECSGNTYARKPVPASSFSAAVNGANSNSAIITFVTPTGTWGLVTSMFGVNDLSGTAGDLLWFDNTTITDQTPLANDTVQLEIGAFVQNLN